MKTLEKIFIEQKTDKKITIDVRLSEKNALIVSQQLPLSKLVNNTREFVNRINILTLPYVGKNCYITIDGIELSFEGGKFASNVQKLAKVYVINHLLLENDVERAKLLRNEFYSYIDERCKNLIDVVKLIKFVSTVKPYELAQSLNGLKIATTNE
jgi:hypothetical protein